MPEDTPVEETLEESEKQRREEIAELRTLIEFSPEEAPAFEEALQQVEERKAEVTAADQARKDETQTVKELDLEGLLYKVQTGRESLSQGRVVAGYGSPEDILATHAKDLGLSLTEYKDRLAKYEIGWEGMTSDVAHLGKSPEEVLASAKKYNPYLQGEKQREAHKRREKTREDVLQGYVNRGEEIPAYLVEDTPIWDDETAGFYGTDVEELENIAREGEVSYVAATIRAQALMADPKVAEYVREFEARDLGGEDYFKNRTADLMEDYQRRNSEAYAALNADGVRNLHSRFSKSTFAELATLKTVGLWTAPIFLRKEYLDDPEGGVTGQLVTRVRDISWIEALSPTIEVIGIARKGRGQHFVLRQAGAMQTTFDVVDSPKSAVIGLLRHGNVAGAKQGVAERAQGTDFARGIAYEKNLGTLATAGALLTGLAIDVGFADLFSAAAVGTKASKAGVRGAKGLGEAGNFIRDSEKVLLAYKEGKPELYSKLSLELSAKYPHLIDQVDSMQVGMTPLLAKSNPDILDTKLADSLPGKAGELEVNLAPDVRKLRAKVRVTKEVEGAAPIEEAVTPSTVTRGKGSSLDDMQRQLDIVEAEKAKLVDKPTIPQQYPAQLNRKIITLGDRAQATAAQAGDASAGVKLRKKIQDTLPDALENPSAWNRSMSEYIQKELPGLEMGPGRKAGQSYADYIAELKRTLPEDEFAALKKELDLKHRARKSIVDDLVKIQMEAVKLRKRLQKEAGTTAQQLALLDKAEAAIKTNMEARAAALYLVYSDFHGGVSVFRKPLGVGKLRKDLLEASLMDDLQEYSKLSEVAAYFAHGLSTVFGLKRREALIAARIMDARARNWAFIRDRKASDWWETRFGRIESRADMRKRLKEAKKGKDSPDKPKPDDSTDKKNKELAEDLEEIEENTGPDELPEDFEPPIDVDDWDNAPPLHPLPPAPVGMPKPSQRRGYPGETIGYAGKLDPEAPGHPPNVLYDHLVQFDYRVNPKATTKDVAQWMFRHAKHPASRTLAQRIIPFLPDNSSFYIQNSGGTLSKGSIRGYWDMGTDWAGTADWDLSKVTIKGSGYKWSGLGDEIILHELIHNATNQLIHNPPNEKVRKAVDALGDFADKIIEEAKIVVKQGKKKRYKSLRGDWIYPMSSADKVRYDTAELLLGKTVWGGSKKVRAAEVVTYALTRPAVQHFLRDIDIKVVLKAGEKPRTLYSKFIELLGNLLSSATGAGKKMPKKEQNALHRAMLLSDDLFMAAKAPAKHRIPSKPGEWKKAMPGPLTDANETISLASQKYHKALDEFSRPFKSALTTSPTEWQIPSTLWSEISGNEVLYQFKTPYRGAHLAKVLLSPQDAAHTRSALLKKLDEADENALKVLKLLDGWIQNPSKLQGPEGFPEEWMNPSNVKGFLESVREATVDLQKEHDNLRSVLKAEELGEAPFGAPGAPGPLVKTDIDTPEFETWFGDSKVVDEAGKPLVVYHGTPRGRFSDVARKQNKGVEERDSLSKEKSPLLQESFALAKEKRAFETAIREGDKEAYRLWKDKSSWPEGHWVSTGEGSRRFVSGKPGLQVLDNPIGTKMEEVGPPDWVAAHKEMQRITDRSNYIDSRLQAIDKRLGELPVGPKREPAEVFRTSSGGTTDMGYRSSGTYFTADPKIAQGYAESRAFKEGHVYETYLSFKNPYTGGVTKDPPGMWDEFHDLLERKRKSYRPYDWLDAREGETSSLRTQILKKYGFDSEIWDLKDGTKEYIAFEPTQIKSVYNRGTWDPADPGILRGAPGAPGPLVKTDIDTPEFENWFSGRSLELVDDAGNPTPFFHGGGDIEGGTGVFKASKRGALGKGIYFTPSRERATGYAVEHSLEAGEDVGGAVTEAYINLKNPLILKGDVYAHHPVVDGLVSLGMDQEKASRLVERVEEQHGYIGSELQRLAKKQGYDGIIQYDRAGEEISEVVAFESNQIKSVYNRGTWDPADPGILRGAPPSFRGQAPAETSPKPRDVDSPEFREWRGEAPIIKPGDEIPEGPVVLEVFHGSPSEVGRAGEDFAGLSPQEKANAPLRGGMPGSRSMGPAIYTTRDFKTASEYAGDFSYLKGTAEDVGGYRPRSSPFPGSRGGYSGAARTPTGEAMEEGLRETLIRDPDIWGAEGAVPSGREIPGMPGDLGVTHPVYVKLESPLNLNKPLASVTEKELKNIRNMVEEILERQIQHGRKLDIEDSGPAWREKFARSNKEYYLGAIDNQDPISGSLRPGDPGLTLGNLFSEDGLLSVATDVSDIFKKYGYDGVISNPKIQVDEIIVFKTEQTKSKFIRQEVAPPAPLGGAAPSPPEIEAYAPFYSALEEVAGELPESIRVEQLLGWLKKQQIPGDPKAGRVTQEELTYTLMEEFITDLNSRNERVIRGWLQTQSVPDDLLEVGKEKELLAFGNKSAKRTRRALQSKAKKAELSASEKSDLALSMSVADSATVTRDEVLDYIRKNKVDVTETAPGTVSPARKAAEEANDETFNRIKQALPDANVSDSSQHALYAKGPTELPRIAARPFVKSLTEIQRRLGTQALDVKSRVTSLRSQLRIQWMPDQSQNYAVGKSAKALFRFVHEDALPPSIDFKAMGIDVTYPEIEDLEALGELLKQDPALSEEVLAIGDKLLNDLQRASDLADPVQPSALNDLIILVDRDRLRSPSLSPSRQMEKLRATFARTSGADLQAVVVDVQKKVEEILGQSAHVNRLEIAGEIAGIDAPGNWLRFAGRGYDDLRDLAQTPEWKAWGEAHENVRKVKAADPSDSLGPHYSSYVSGTSTQTPHNYREVLIQLPVRQQYVDRTPEELLLDAELESRLAEAPIEHRWATRSAFMQEHPNYFSPQAGYSPDDQAFIAFFKEIEDGNIPEVTRKLQDAGRGDWISLNDDEAMELAVEVFNKQNPGARIRANEWEGSIGTASRRDLNQVSHNWNEARTGKDGGYPNVVAHFRTRDIVDPEGRRVLFVEEVQSDWHQEARAQGYSAKENAEIRAKLQKQIDDIKKYLADDDAVLKESGVLDEINAAELYRPDATDFAFKADPEFGGIPVRRWRLQGFDDAGEIIEFPAHSTLTKEQLDLFDAMTGHLSQRELSRRGLRDLDHQVGALPTTAMPNPGDEGMFVLQPGSWWATEEKVLRFLKKGDRQGAIQAITESVRKNQKQLSGRQVANKVDKLYVDKWSEWGPSRNWDRLAPPPVSERDWKLFLLGKKREALAKKKQYSLQDKLYENETKGPLPDAPFKKTWPEVAIKRIIHLASEEGYDSIAFTKGDVIQSFVGGDLAGQRYFYDNVLPSVIEKEAKKIGATVEHRADLDFGDLDAGDVDVNLERLQGTSYSYSGRTLAGAKKRGRIEIAEGKFVEAGYPQAYAKTEVLYELAKLDIVDDVVLTASDPGVLTIRLTPDIRESVLPGRPLFQKRIEAGVEVEKSAVEFMEDGRAVLIALEKPDFSSVIHEIGHILRRDMDPEDLESLVSWMKSEPHNLDVKVEGVHIVGKDAVRAEEIFAEAFENYVRSGIAPSKGLERVFAFAKHFMAQIWATLTRDPEVVVAPEIRAILDKMLTETPSEGKFKNFKRAVRHNIRGTKEAPSGIANYHGFRRVLKDKPIGVNAELGEVSAEARIAEEVRRVLPPGQKILTEAQINTKVKRLIEDLDEGIITKDDAILELPVPIMHHRFGPEGKSSFTIEELVQLQSKLEAERIEALTTTAPGAFLRGKQEVIEELTPVDRLRNVLEGPSRRKVLGRAWLWSMFGGDSAKVGEQSLRKFPPTLRSQFNAAGRVIEEAYGNVIRLIDEGDLGKVNDFLTGTVVSFKFGGRQAFASGWDSFGSISRQLTRIVGDISTKTKTGMNTFGPEISLVTLNQVFDVSKPWKKTKQVLDESFENAYPALVVTKMKEPVEVAMQMLGKMFAGMDPSASSSFTRDVGQALEITQVPTAQQFKFAEALLYYTGVTSRNGKSVFEKGLSAKERVAKLLDQTELAFGGGTQGAQARSRVSVLIAGHGQTERVIRNMAAQGMAFEERTWVEFIKWTEGEAVSPKMMVEVKKLARSVGLSPNMVPEKLLDTSFMLPKAARARIGEALARGQERFQHGAGTLSQLKAGASEADIAGMTGAGMRYMKLRMTRGAVALRQRYFFMNTLDHFAQMALIAGFRPAIVSTIRVAAQDVMVLPGVARSLAVVDKFKPGSMEAFRRVLQRSGDVGARAVGTLLRVSKYRVDLNAILDGREGFVQIGNKVYSNREIRDIMVEEGVFASFDTTQLTNVIRRTGQRGSLAKQADKLPPKIRDAGRWVGKTADDLILKTVTDTAEAWAERERAGAVLTLIEMGMSPRAASRVTIDALYDYAGTMSKFDRSWIVSLLFPFWAFQKNANMQAFNAIFSPAGIYRLGVIRRAQDKVPEVFSELLQTKLSEDPNTGIPTPYGVYLADMTPQQRDVYYTIVHRLESGYGPIDQMSESTKELVLSSYDADTFDKISDQQLQVIQYGYGPAYMMPEETREAVRALFKDARNARAVDGKLLLLSEDTLEKQTGYLTRDPGVRRRALDDVLKELRPFAAPDMSPAGQRNYMKGRGRFPFPPVYNKNTRDFYETMRQLDPENETPYLEWNLPDSTINAGFRHMANINATYILMGYKAVDLFADLDAPGVTPLIPFEEVLDISNTPIPGTILEALTEERMGYPRRVHPIIGKLVEDVMPGVSVLRIDATKMEDDPFAQAEAMTFANDQEYQEYVDTGQRTLVKERVYLPPGTMRFLFDNSPLGELNRVMMTMPSKIPFTDIESARAGVIDYRSKYEQVQDPEQLIQWARFVLGIDVKETTPTKTARLEERRIPKELR